MNFDARQVANCLLDIGDDIGISVSHLALQKIVYFAHGHSFSKFSQGLIANRIEAWQHGPVVRELYSCFKNCGDELIRSRAMLHDPIERISVLVTYDFDSDVRDFLNDMMSFYGRMNPWTLRQMSHVAGGPWDQTIAHARVSTNVGLQIADEAIEAYFLGGGVRFDLRG